MNTISAKQANHSTLLSKSQRINNSSAIISEEIQRLFDYCNSYQETDSQKLIATLLKNAIAKRFQTGKVHEHIYLKNDEVPQIQLFNILIEKFPFVKYSQLITNQAIIETIGDSSEVTIIDIGVGQGAQMLHIIEGSKQLKSLKKLHIIGIEPFGDALQIAELNIRACKESVHFELEFTGIHKFAEEIDFNQFSKIPGRLIVNASLALHHIQSATMRLEILRAIKKLNPYAFILIEPNVDHYEPNFTVRFMNCYHHYYNIFKVIDRLEIDAPEKNALKLFFGREIEDVIGKKEKDRFEKHEKAFVWIDRLEQSGFVLNKTILKSPVSSEVGVSIAYHAEGFLGFTNEAETVLAVMYAN